MSYSYPVLNDIECSTLWSTCGVYYIGFIRYENLYNFKGSTSTIIAYTIHDKRSRFRRQAPESTT
jgi:hypothetical protein